VEQPINKDKKRVFTLPAIVIVAIVTQIPLILTIYDSLFRRIIVRPDLPRSFIGFTYYTDLFTSVEFWIVFKNTIALTVSSLVVCLLLGLLFALLLYKPFPGVGLARTLLISPFFIMDSVIGVFWRNVMLQPSYGLIHYAYNLFDLQAPDLLARNPLFVVIILIIWKWTPFFLLVLIAGLQNISQDMLDAAMVDGANAWNMFYRLILPSLRKYLSICLILGFIFIIKTFGLIFTTTKGGPGFSSTNFPFHVYRTTFLGWNIGKGAAIATVLVFISLIIIMILFRMLRTLIMEHEL
jgi:sorbitol/mannitol transport system permease protein